MDSSSLRIIFAGTPEFAVPTLQALIGSTHQLLSVYTQPDRPAGRGRRPRPGPIKLLAEENAIPVYQPEALKDKQVIEAIEQQQADIMVVVAYGIILPVAILKLAKYGCLNVHASLLPRWRGAAPIQRAILAGDSETGVTIMQMDKGLDTGGVLKASKVEINDTDSGQTLHDRLSGLGARALLEVVNRIANGNKPTPQSQDEAHASYAHKLEKAEAEIDWAMSARQLDRQIRAFNPWPVAYTYVDNQPLRIWAGRCEEGMTEAEAGTIVSADRTGISVATGDGVITLTEVQPAGKKPMPAGDFVNARRDRIKPGIRLGACRT